MSRAAPQLNVFAVGFPVTLGLGFILMWITLPEALARFSEWVDAVFELAGGLLLAG